MNEQQAIPVKDMVATAVINGEAIELIPTEIPFLNIWGRMRGDVTEAEIRQRILNALPTPELFDIDVSISDDGIAVSINTTSDMSKDVINSIVRDILGAYKHTH